MIKTIKFKRFLKSLAFIFSILTLSSCLSTKQAEPTPSKQEEQAEIVTNSTENSDIQNQTLPLFEETELSNTQESFEESSEKIDWDEILTNPNTEENTDFFSEPEVFEAEPEEISENPINQIVEAEEQDLPKDVDTESQKEEIINKTQTVDTSSDVAENPLNLKENTEKQTTAPTIEQGSDEVLNDSERTAEENSPSNQETSGDNLQQKNSAIISPSRSMSVKNNQYVDVVYPGSGWIYIGEVGSENLFRYFGRKLGSKDTTFTLRSSKSGKTILHFYKNDILTSQYIDDYLEVVVEEDSAKSGEKATAPAYALVVPPKPVRNEEHFSTKKSASQVEKTNDVEKSPSIQQKKEDTPPQEFAVQSSKAQDDNLKTIIQTTQEKENPTSAQQRSSAQNGSNQNLKADEQDIPLTSAHNTSGSLLEQAKKSYSAKNYENALTQIQEYLDSANTKIDEALFVQAQILEADSKVRNIKSALDSYETIIKKYPTSKFWQNANKRKIYLERYYINIY